MLDKIVRTINFTGFTQTSRDLIDRLYSKRVIFIHIPKCGGTSLSHMLRARYLLSHIKIEEGASHAACYSQSTPEWFDFKRRLAKYYAAKGLHFIQGHFSVDGIFLDDHSENFKLVTLLRHPVERLVSHYHYDTRYKSMSVDDFLGSPEGARECRVLCHFFGELPWTDKHDIATLDHAVITALSNLKRLDVVAILERPDITDQEFKQCLGFEPRSPHRNVTADTKAGNRGFSDSQLDRVKQLCKRDLDIYNQILESKTRFSDLGVSDLLLNEDREAEDVVL